jgi:hypothetical protein
MIRPASVAAIDSRIAEFIGRVEREREHLFHLHLQETIRCTSPLLLDLAAMEGISIADAVAGCRPPEDWPRVTRYDYLPNRLRGTQLPPTQPGSTNQHEERRFRRAFSAPGVIIRQVDNPRGRFAVRPFAGMLAFTAAIGSYLLSSFGATATLMLREPLPETLAVAMPGRPLGLLIDHPLFTEHICRVMRVDSHASTGASVLSFRVPLVEFEMPLGERGAGASA